jgi:hypothetical protein
MFVIRVSTRFLRGLEFEFDSEHRDKNPSASLQYAFRVKKPLSTIYCGMMRSQRVQTRQVEETFNKSPMDSSRY